MPRKGNNKRKAGYAKSVAKRKSEKYIKIRSRVEKWERGNDK